MNLVLSVQLWEIEQDLVDVVSDVFYELIDKAVNLLTTNPKDWAVANGIWNTIESINNSLITIAVQLAVIFFLIGFVERSINIKEQVSLIDILMLFIRIGITEYFIVHSLDIISYLFEFTTSLTGLTNVTSKYIDQTGMATHIYDMSSTSNIVFLFPTILYLIIVPACGAMIVIQAMERFFKVYLSVPYGVLAFSTVSSGSRHVSETTPGYVKYMLSALLEGFSLALALQIGLRLFLFGDGFISFDSISVSNHLLPATLKIIRNIINVVMLTVVCHMSEGVAARALRLDR